MLASPPMKEVADGVWQLTGFPPHGINEYLLGDVLVDAGARQSKRQILKDLRGHAVTAHALTHAHGDHQGASKAVCESLDVPFWVGAADADAAERPRAHPRAPARQADQQGVLEGHGRPRAARSIAAWPRATRWPASRSSRCPGHSAGHLAFWRGSDGVLVLGDVLNNQERAHRLSRRPAPAVRLLHARPGAEPPVGQAPGRAGAQARCCSATGRRMRDTKKFVDFTGSL